MFAIRDQENLTHAHQTAAAAKPLNQNLRGVAGKTPSAKAPRTPFKVALNDENAGAATGKAGGKTLIRTVQKGNENAARGGGGKGGKDTVVTPAPPRTTARAPLGLKSTNAKARAVPTPAALQTTAQKTVFTNKYTHKRSPRLQRGKVQVHPGVLSPRLDATEEDDDLEIEHVPIKPVPLPDDPVEIYARESYPALAPENLMRGCVGDFLNAKDDEGFPIKQRKADARHKVDLETLDKDLEKYVTDDLEKLDADLRINLGLPAIKPKPSAPVQKAKHVSKPSTLTSRAAASKLSSTSTVKSKTSRPITTTGNPNVARSQPSTSAARRTNTTAAPNATASKSTLGYTKGRAALSQLREARSTGAATTTISSARASSPKPTPTNHPNELDMIQRLTFGLGSNLTIDDADVDVGGAEGGGEGWDVAFDANEDMEEAMEEFVLGLPEGMH